MADTSTNIVSDAPVELPISHTAAAVSTNESTYASTETSTDAPVPKSSAPRKTNKENLGLFDRTKLVFTTSISATQTLIKESNKNLPLAITKLEMAERILPAGHPQRQKHIDAVANIWKLEALGSELISAIASQRAAFYANTPEYSTGLFAEHNQTCVARLLATIKDACANFRNTYPKVADDAYFKRLEGLESHFERCTSCVWSEKPMTNEIRVQPST